MPAAVAMPRSSGHSLGLDLDRREPVSPPSACASGVHDQAKLAEAHQHGDVRVEILEIVRSDLTLRDVDLEALAGEADQLGHGERVKYAPLE